MAKEVTRITLTKGQREVSVEILGTDLDYVEFMELVETMIMHSGYPQYQIAAYIKQWAKDINASANN